MSYPQAQYATLSYRGSQPLGQARAPSSPPMAYAEPPRAYFEEVEKPLVGNAAVDPLYYLLNPRNFMIFIGVTLLTILAIMPVWDASNLLHDPIFIYFFGRTWPTLTILVCVGAVVIYVAIVVAFWRLAREEAKNEQTMMMISFIVMTALGLALLGIAQPLKRESELLYKEVSLECATGAHTSRLYEYATVMQGMRNTSECALKRSIEECDGYQDTMPYTGFLKELELRYRCSGFCQATNATGWDSEGALPQASTLQLAAKLPADAPLLRQTQNMARPSSRGSAADAFFQSRGPSLLSVMSNVATRLVGGQEHTAMLQVGVRGGDLAKLGVSALASPSNQEPGALARPVPTLFTNANYQASCDGTVARSLRFGAGDTAQLLYIEALVLLFCAVISTSLKVVSLTVHYNRVFDAARRAAYKAQAIAGQAVPRQMDL